MIRILLLALATTACTDVEYRGDPWGPEYRGIDAIEGLELSGQKRALRYAQHYVEEYWRGGLSLGQTWDDATVYWSDQKCPHDKSQYAVVFDGECHHGLGWNCLEMYVALSDIDESKACGSALIHEFGHCLRSQLSLDDDREHLDKAWWEMMNAAELYPCEQEW